MRGLVREIHLRAYGAIAGFCKRSVVAFAILAAGIGAARADGPVIAILGDSLIAGYGLAPQAGLVPQLQAWLNGQGADIRLLNAGVSGDTTAGGLARLDWTLTPEVDALVVSLGANDMLRGLPVEDARANLDAILARTADKGLPVLVIGFQSPSNWGPDYKRAFDAMYPELAEQHGAGLIPSFFAPLSPDGSAGVAVKYLQPDGLHPNPEGVALLVEALGPHLLDLGTRIP